jgi:tRNA nucleotidyltransferase/poly(A) polymerase
VEEDLSRRDFTINALAWHPLRKELLDPFDGQRDLREGRLRTVGEPAERFAEDYLRILRGLRFAGQFELVVDPPTWEALRALVPRLDELSAERVREELIKTLGKVGEASRTLELSSPRTGRCCGSRPCSTASGCHRHGRRTCGEAGATRVTKSSAPARPRTS